MAQSRRNVPKYVYDIPYFERMELCRILDQNDKWEELGGVYMNFDMLTIQTLRREILRGNSPTDELLTKWGHQNHTILELFVLLSKMQHYQAMLTIKEFVDVEYHRLIYEGEQNLSRLFKSKQNTKLYAANDSSNQKYPQTSGNSNINSPEEKILNGQENFPLNLNAPSSDENNRNNAQTALMNRVTNDATNESKDASKYLKPESAKDKNVSEISSVAESVGILPVITFKELEIATNGWDQTTILGKGGFGTVYKGTWKNTAVAIKRTRNSETDENHSIQMQQILGELKMLNSYRHDNILPLYGFSMDKEDPCLIYQYMPNGSVEDRLLCRNGTKPLSWSQRHNIATGTARGLQFLHTIGEKPLIHGDIKTANILLDSNFEPKIGDFGLAREGPYSHYTHMKVSRVHGTRPYLPDEFLRHKKFSTKVDTHSFGIVLFELCTGLRAFDDQRPQKFLKDLIETTHPNQLGTLMDKKGGPDEHQTFSKLITLGKCCVSKKPKDRPEMVIVLQELNAMAVKRDLIVKVQNLIKQNSLTPSTPYEIQVFHDHLSQQKKVSPISSNGIFRVPSRAISPLQPNFFQADRHPTGNAASLEAQANFNINNVNNNPFLPLDALKIKEKQNRELGTMSPILKENQDLSFVANKELSKIEASLQSVEPNANELKYRPPVISVSPPSGSQSSSVSSEEEALPSEKNLNNEDLDYDYTSNLDNLPLISVLGIKGKAEDPKKDDKTEKTDEAAKQNESADFEVITSAKSKRLWILDDPS